MLDIVTNLFKLLIRLGIVNTIYNKHYKTIRDFLQLKQIKCILD